MTVLQPVRRDTADSGCLEPLAVFPERAADPSFDEPTLARANAAPAAAAVCPLSAQCTIEPRKRPGLERKGTQVPRSCVDGVSVFGGVPMASAFGVGRCECFCLDEPRRPSRFLSNSLARRSKRLCQKKGDHRASAIERAATVNGSRIRERSTAPERSMPRTFDFKSNVYVPRCSPNAEPEARSALRMISGQRVVAAADKLDGSLSARGSAIR